MTSMPSGSRAPWNLHFEGYHTQGSCYNPRQSARAVVLLTPGYGEHLGRYNSMIKRLLNQGLRVYTYENRGHGVEGSDGRIDISRLIADHGEACARIQRANPGQPLILAGHSMGATIVACTAFSGLCETPPAGLILSSPALNLQPQIGPWLLGALRALAAVFPGLPTSKIDPDHLTRRSDVARQYVEDPLVYSGRVPLVSAVALIDASRAALAQAAAAPWSYPVLMLQGTEDRVVNPAGAKELAAIARRHASPLELHEFVGGRHELFNDLAAREAYAVVEQWVENLLR